MRAIQQQSFGGPEVLEVVELADPEPGEHDVLVDVTHAGLNFADIHAREDSYVAKQSLPRIPGSEVAGRRVDTGERVVGLPRGGVGGYAERAIVPTCHVVPIPDGLEDGAALALLLQGLTAWHLYRTCARVQEGEIVVVISGAGGVGTLAIQLGRLFGARVIATASTPERRERCRELGAEAAIDGDADGLAERIIDATGGEHVDAVFEMSGGRVFDECLEALAIGGRIVPYGISSKDQNSVRTGRLLKRSQSVIGFWLFHHLDAHEDFRDPLAELYGHAAAGRLTASVGATYPLADAPRAQIELAERRTTGKLLLDVTA